MSPDYATLRRTSRIHRDGLRRRSDLVVELLRPVRAGSFRLLDVGCADGRMFAALRSAFPEAHLEGLEVAPDLVAVATAAGWAVRAGRVEAPPFPDQRFDVVTVVATLKHVPDADAALAACHRLLVPGGHLVVVDPTPLGVRLGRLGGHFDPRYLPSVWSLAETRRRVADAGFEVLRAVRAMPAPVAFPGHRALERGLRALGLSRLLLLQGVLARARPPATAPHPSVPIRT